MEQAFFSICIGRQLASGGREVGRRLAERLGAAYYDSEILDLAARESGLCREAFERNDERKGFFGTAVRSMSSFIGMGAQYPGQSRDIELFTMQSEAIQKAASEGNCIFIGRAADYVLRNHPRCLSVFISADETARIGLLCREKGIGESEARNLMDRVDAKRASFYNFYSGKKWGDARSYDLCINVTRVGIEKAVNMIAEAL